MFIKIYWIFLILIVGLIDNMIVFKGLLAIIAILVLIYSRIIANIERGDKYDKVK